MTIGSFDTLPIDILLSIFARLPPASIRQCQKVCRSLRRLISKNDYLQYILELEASGYVEPLRPRMDLSYAERTQFLRKHNSRWKNLSSVTPVHYDLPAYQRTGLDRLVKGTFVWGQFTASGKAFSKVMFYQLPSTNTGTDFKQWSIDLVGGCDNIEIDPAQDLLVVVETRSASDALMNDEPFNIRLKTMSTAEPHSKAPQDQKVLCYTPPSGSWHSGPCHVWIFGHLLAGMFNVDFISNLVVWNWTTGQELTYLTIAWSSPSYDLELLSERSFVICRPAYSSDANQSFPHDTFGWLSVYQFNPDATIPTQAIHVVSFALPACDPESVWSYYMTMHSAPAIAPLSAQNYPSSPAKVYDLTPNDRLLRVDVSMSWSEGRGGLVGSLYVNASVLLAIQQPSHELIPWHEWANRASWVSSSGLPPHCEPSIFGHRLVAQQTSQDGTPSSQIILLDFDQRRLKTHGTSALGSSTALSGNHRIRYSRAQAKCIESILEIEGASLATDRWESREVMDCTFIVSSLYDVTASDSTEIIPSATE
ncbi:hypothetical protein FRC12_001104 [Ceratobasidium sp. 428]|nr:hypothetical protein FRC12_001104 [Ceratobasidium sp. 428]